jgi:hypothetical protein
LKWLGIKVKIDYIYLRQEQKLRDHLKIKTINMIDIEKLENTYVTKKENDAIRNFV